MDRTEDWAFITKCLKKRFIGVRACTCVSLCVCVSQVFGSHLMRVKWELNLCPLEKQWALNH